MSLTSIQTPQHYASRSWLISLSAVAALGIAGLAAGKATKLLIPDGAIGIKDSLPPLKAGKKVEEVPSGEYLFGQLRFIGVRTFELGAEQKFDVVTRITQDEPGGVGSPIDVKSTVTLSISSEEVDSFLPQLSSTDYEKDIERVIGQTLSSHRLALNPDALRTNLPALNNIVSGQVAEALKIKEIRVEITTLVGWLEESPSTRGKGKKIPAVLFDSTGRTVFPPQ